MMTAWASERRQKVPAQLQLEGSATGFPFLHKPGLNVHSTVPTAAYYHGLLVKANEHFDTTAYEVAAGASAVLQLGHGRLFSKSSLLLA
jgi:hypothetical protein